MRGFPEREWGAFWQLGDVGVRPRLWCEGTCPERPLAQLLTGCSHVGRSAVRLPLQRGAVLEGGRDSPSAGWLVACPSRRPWRGPPELCSVSRRGAPLQAADLWGCPMFSQGLGSLYITTHTLISDMRAQWSSS